MPPSTIVLTAAATWTVKATLKEIGTLTGDWYQVHLEETGGARIRLRLAPPANAASRQLAWAVYVELTSRVVALPLGEEEGVDRSTLRSLFALFQRAREALIEAGPDASMPNPDCQDAASVGALLLLMLNAQLWPFLAHWHPIIPEEKGEDWDSRAVFRAELGALQRDLRQVAVVLEKGLGIQRPASLMIGSFLEEE